MKESAGFYQTFYQNETLFRVRESLGIAEEELVRPEIKEQKPALVEAKKPAMTEDQKPGPEEAKLAPLATPAPPSVAPFPVLQHRVLVLIDEKKQAQPDPADALLLDNILKAVGHDPAATDLLNFSHLPQADARTVLAQKSTNYFISFGVPLIKLKLDLLLPPFSPKQIEGIWFLLAEPLSVIDADKEMKKRLWLALKKMFAVA